MIVGNPETFALESEIAFAYEQLSTRALGLFAIHIGAQCFGVRDWNATMLATSFDEIGRRIAARGRHQASHIAHNDAEAIATAFRRALYLEHPENELFFGMPAWRFAELIHSHDLTWAPDGDEAVDDGSYVLQFDVHDRVRLIGFKCARDPLLDPGTLRDVWLCQDDFYNILQRWHSSFEAEWKSSSKVAGARPFLQ